MHILYIDSHNNISSLVFSNFQLDYCQNEDALHFNLETTDRTFAYIIRSDTREPSIDAIREHILNEIQSALVGNSVFCITEYLDRNYIYIGINESRRQFSACFA